MSLALALPSGVLRNSLALALALALNVRRRETRDYPSGTRHSFDSALAIDPLEPPIAMLYQRQHQHRALTAHTILTGPSCGQQSRGDPCFSTSEPGDLNKTGLLYLWWVGLSSYWPGPRLVRG